VYERTAAPWLLFIWSIYLTVGCIIRSVKLFVVCGQRILYAGHFCLWDKCNVVLCVL